MPTLRPEHPTDAAAIHALLTAAFPTPAEARLVDLLREHHRLRLSLVAVAVDESTNALVGHIAFSAVEIDGTTFPAQPLGLAPVAVHPQRQRQGIGTLLIRAGLDACRAAAVPFVVVLGDPAYYRRFGFTTAADAGLANEYGAHDEFMVLELIPGTLPKHGGLIRYAPEFAIFSE